MGGVFMRKLLRRLMICCMIAVFLWCTDIICEKRKLSEYLIPFPAVVSSNRPDDSFTRWEIADSVLKSIQQNLAAVSDISAAKAYLKQTIPKIQHIMQKAITVNGCPQLADSFSLTD
jgi:hypothetical protein